MFNPENQLEQPKKPTDWEILGVSEDATPEEIKAAYRRAVKEVHPDIKKDGDGEAFKQIQKAYERLSGKTEKPKESKPTTRNQEVARVARMYGETQNDWDKEVEPDPADPNKDEGLWE